MRAIVLIGHGSLRSASGASMIRIAARLRQQGVASLVEPAFLNYSKPTLLDVIEKCIARGVTEVLVQPYFLLSGVYVDQDLPKLIAEQARSHPQVSFQIGVPFLDHPALAQLARKRIAEVTDRIEAKPADRALLIMAHGTPLASANAPLCALIEQCKLDGGFSHVMAGYLECNEPTIPSAIDALVEMGAETIVALPYFLHLGRHVREDLPAQINVARTDHPGVDIYLAHHLGYDLLLVDVIRDRLRQARRFEPLADG